MRPKPPFSRLLLAGLSSVAICACSSSSSNNGGTGGGVVASGGTAVSASGGAAGDGSGGTSVAPGGAGAGGASVGGTAAGGASGDGTGGARPGTGGRTAATGGRSAGTGGGTTGGDGGTSASSTGGRSTGTGGGGGTNAGSTGGRSTGTGGATGAGGGTFSGTCTKSKSAGANATGSGPHAVVVETNADPGINEGTIFRPADLGGSEKYPIFVWGEGACTKNGLSNVAAMGEIASHGYFVVADGPPNGTDSRPMDRSNLPAMAAPLLAYIDWAIAENEKPCSAYYHSLDTTKVSANGFSCGGLMSQATVPDPRITTWGVTSSGMAGAPQSYYGPIHTPVLFVEGGPSDSAYNGGKEGYQNISKLGVPVMWFSKDLGHGGDLTRTGGGDFTKINLAWLNWWLKGDETATGKGLLVGAGCTYCKDSAWEVMSANVP